MNWNGKLCGLFNTKTKIYTSRRTQKHFCFKYNGWGIQKIFIEQLAQLRCKIVRIEILDTDGTIKPIDTPFINYMNNGIEACLNKCDGIQVFLPISFFKPMDKTAALESFNLFGW